MRRAHQFRDDARSLEEVLEIVQHDEHLSPLHEFLDDLHCRTPRFAQTERLGEGGQDLIRVLHKRQRHEYHPVHELTRQAR